MKIINAGTFKRAGVNVGIWIKLDKPVALTGGEERDEWILNFDLLADMIDLWTDDIEMPRSGLHNKICLANETGVPCNDLLKIEQEYVEYDIKKYSGDTIPIPPKEVCYGVGIRKIWPMEESNNETI